MFFSCIYLCSLACLKELGCVSPRVRMTETEKCLVNFLSCDTPPPAAAAAAAEFSVTDVQTGRKGRRFTEDKSRKGQRSNITKVQTHNRVVFFDQLWKMDTLWYGEETELILGRANLAWRHFHPTISFHEWVRGDRQIKLEEWVWLLSVNAGTVCVFHRCSNRTIAP